MNKATPLPEEIFAAALEHAAGPERAAFVHDACAKDAALRQEVESLLAAHEQASGFMRSQALAGPQTVVLAEKAGDRIGRYRLLEQIGEGGFGVVWMAEQEEPVRRRVALKIIKLGMDTREVVTRFEAERQALAMMEHPNIASVFDGGATDTGRPYFVMELVKGIPITEYCDAARLSTRARLELFIQVCQAVQHAHQKGVIHRDLKPSNVLVTVKDDRPVPKVIDFGVAKATQARLTEKTLFTRFNQWIGTPAYMSPEQAGLASLDVDTRSDVYSLGVLLYELLTGRTPFDTQKLMEAGYEGVMRTIREQEPPKPSTRLSTLADDELHTVATQRGAEPARLGRLVRGDLDWIVMKALEKDRARRYETASALARDLECHLKQQPVVARPPSNLYRFQKLLRRNKLAFAAGSLIVVSLVLGVSVSTLLFFHEKVAHARAVAAEKNAQTEARRAEAASAEAKMTLSASDFFQGARLTTEGNASDALAFLGRSLSGHPMNDAALTWLTTLLTYHSWALPVSFVKHGSYVTTAQFSPDGKRIVTASSDKTACVWDAQSGQLLTPPLRHGSNVLSAQCSPDGKRIVTASSDKTARVWDAQTGRPLAAPLPHNGIVYSAQFSPGGKRIVTGSSDKTARVWDAQSGQPLGEPLRHGGGVLSAQFSPDARRIVTIAEDRTVRVWDAQSGQPLTDALAHESLIRSAQFSPDGKTIVTATYAAAQCWDAQSGRRLPRGIFHQGDVWSARFSPDGTRILTASGDQTARVWWNVGFSQAVNRAVPLLKHNAEVRSAEFSPDGKLIVTTSEDWTARVWDAWSGQPLTEPMNHSHGVRSARFSPDGKRIVTVSEDNTVCVWDAQNGRAVTEPLRHGGYIWSAQFSPDGKQIVTASNDDTARAWDAQSGQALIMPLQHGEPVHSAQFSPDGKRIVTASYDKTARVWDAQTGQPLAEPMGHGSNVVSAEFSPDGKRIVTASYDRTARVWDAQTGQPLTGALQHHGRVFSAQFSPDGMRVATASDDKTARVWDTQTGRPLTEPLKHSHLVESAQFSPDGKRIVTPSYDNTARVWDAQTGQPLTEPVKHNGPVRSARFSPDGRRIVTASMDNTARVWDAQSGQPLTEPLRHKEVVWSAEFSPDGKRVVTASQDNTARLWDSQSGQRLTEPLKHSHWVTTARFSPDGKRIVTASYDMTARVWDIAPTQARYPDWLLQLSEAISGQALNKQGLLEPTKLNRVEILGQLRQKLNQELSQDDWLAWGRWFLADRGTRTISPFASLTVPQYVQHRIQENTLESLQEAVRLAPTNGLAFARLAKLVMAQNDPDNPPPVAEADFLSRHALKLAPDEGEVQRIRAEIIGAVKRTQNP